MITAVTNQRTIIGAHLQTTKMLGLHVDIKQNTTLNEKLSIHQDRLLNLSDIPNIKYLVIGNGGHTPLTDASGVVRNESIPHTPADVSLYNQIPFVLRSVNNDLSDIERNKYRLRKKLSIGGVNYIGYYMKVLTNDALRPTIEHRTIAKGVITTTLQDFTSADLNPTVPTINTNTNVVADGTYLVVSAKMSFHMDLTDIQDLISAVTILTGDSSGAIISEIGICSGVDILISDIDITSNRFEYSESLATQINSFIGTYIDVNTANSDISLTMDMGSNEPMMVI